MIFAKPIVGKILRGEVTMTYRMARRPTVGERFFVKARQADPIACHVIVTAVEPRLLGDVTFEHARAIGERTVADFKQTWVRDHDAAWVARWEDEAEDFLAASVARFDSRHRRRSVFAVTFALDHSEHPRLLADRNVRADYVESPARAMGGTADPGEAIDARLQDRYSREGHQGWVAREKARELDREHMLAEERMRLVRIDARAQGVDIGYLEASILQRVRAAERKLYGGKPARKVA